MIHESRAAGAFETGVYPNLFSEWLGRSEAQIRGKLDAAWQHLFYGDDETERGVLPGWRHGLRRRHQQ